MEILYQSFSLIFSFDPNLYEIIFLSLKVSLSALIISTILALPISAFVAIKNFYGKKVLKLFFNSLMALPPVFVGLILYILFSKSGPLGFFEILYTPSIMIVAQIIIILPIIISISIENLEMINKEYEDFFLMFNTKLKRRILTLLWDARFSLITCILSGLGRALSEVGAIIIVGGNIAYLTRTMTTGIVLETSRGNLSIALKLGITLLLISLFINILLYYVKNFGESKLIK